MGDVAGLVEDVQRQVDVDAAERVAAKLKRGRDLDLGDFREQLQQLVKMGGVGALLDKLPGVNPDAAAHAGFDERQIRRQIGIIDAMTPRERRHPRLIDGSRKRRIAAGAGLAVQDVNRVLKQHRQIAKAMKRVKKGGLENLMAGADPRAALRGRRRRM